MKPMMCFDVDGTIRGTTDEHIVYDSTILALKKLKEAGYQIVVSTGRGRDSFLRTGIQDIADWDGFVFNNGQLITDGKGNVINAHHFKNEDVIRTIAKADELNLAVTLKKEHRMLYVLRKLDHVISDEETHQFIEKEIDDLMHKQYVSHTNNPIFDHRLTILMQSLEDYDIKMIVMIPVDTRLDDASIIEQMEIFIREHVTDHTEIRLKVKDNQFIINCNDKTKSIRLKTPH